MLGWQRDYDEHRAECGGRCPSCWDYRLYDVEKLYNPARMRFARAVAARAPERLAAHSPAAWLPTANPASPSTPS
jgi:hypothetical protein